MDKSGGYSGTPLAKKLGFKPGMDVLLVDAPDNYQSLFQEIPDGVHFSMTPDPPLQAIHLFTRDQQHLLQQLPWLRSMLLPHGVIWVSWPKKASGWNSDVTEDVIRDLALQHQLVDVKVASVSAVWSALKLVIPLAYR